MITFFKRWLYLATIANPFESGWRKVYGALFLWCLTCVALTGAVGVLLYLLNTLTPVNG